MSNENFDLSEYLTNKKDSIPEEKTFTRVKKPRSKEIDLRDEIDNFVSWIKKTNVKNFTGKREAVIKRIKKYKRPSLIEGTLELLVKFMKESNIKSIRI